MTHDSVQKSYLDACLDQMLRILLEYFHIPRNAHEDVQLYVDLHQNQKLVERGKYISNNSLIAPVYVSLTLNVLNCFLLGLFVDNEEADADYGTGDCAKNDVAVHKHSELFLG